ncbi:MAG TPA: response regulator [Candidatus Binatia bacterium]|nr:response regulator [Candidatus Binatia bacterium]
MDYHILVVDDQEEQLHMLKNFITSLSNFTDEHLTHTNAQAARKLLKQGTYHLYTAHDTLEAKRATMRRHIDVAFVDRRLGDENGIDLCARLTSKGIPCVMMSGDFSRKYGIDPAILRELSQAGVKETLCKPFNTGEFYNAISHALESKSARQVS